MTRATRALPGVTPRPCRGCQRLFAPAEERPGAPWLTLRATRFCAACRAHTCTTCQGRGQHRAGCPVAAGRARRPRPYRGLVTEHELLEVYARAWGNAVRVAATICGPVAAEDAVQEAATYLWRRRDTLTGIGTGFFVLVVKQRAHHARLDAWHRHARALGPEGLAALQRRRERRILAGR